MSNEEGRRDDKLHRGRSSATLQLAAAASYFSGYVYFQWQFPIEVAVRRRRVGARPNAVVAGVPGSSAASGVGGSPAILSHLQPIRLPLQREAPETRKLPCEFPARFTSHRSPFPHGRGCGVGRGRGVGVTLGVGVGVGDGAPHGVASTTSSTYIPVPSPAPF